MSSNSTLTPPPDGDYNQGPKLLAVTWTWLSLSIIFVVLRLYSHLVLCRSFWWDDGFILFSLANNIAMSVFRTLYATGGYARHSFYLTAAQQVEASKFSWISLGLAIAAHASGRIAIALLIYRIQGPSRWRSWLLKFLMVMIGLTALLAIFLLFFQCSPPSALWNIDLVKTGQAHCLDELATNRYDEAAAGFWCSTDFILASTPITIVWGLQMSTRKKLGICCLLGLGFFAGICAAIKVSYLTTMDSLSEGTDATWILINLLIWDANEINVIIIASCIAVLRPLFLLLTDPHGKGKIFSHNHFSVFRTRDQPKRRPINVDSIGATLGGNDADDMLADSLFEGTVTGLGTQGAEAGRDGRKASESGSESGMGTWMEEKDSMREQRSMETLAAESSRDGRSLYERSRAI